MPRASNHRNAVDLLLDRDLDNFVTTRREQGRSWEQIAAAVNSVIGDIAVTGETLRRWFS